MPPLVAGAEDNREPTDYQTGQQHYTQSQLADWLARAEENAGILAAISPNAAEEAFVLQVVHVFQQNCLLARNQVLKCSTCNLAQS